MCDTELIARIRHAIDTELAAGATPTDAVNQVTTRLLTAADGIGASSETLCEITNLVQRVGDDARWGWMHAA